MILQAELAFKAAIAAICLCLAFTPSATAQQPAPLHVVGNLLQTNTGQTVRLQGVNVASMIWSNDGEGLVLQSAHVAIEQWKSNFIRMGVAQDRWFGRAPGQSDGGVAYRALADSMVSYIASKNCYVLLDLHWSDGGVWGANIDQHKMPDANSTIFWADAARHFANHPAVIFDLYNEPHDISWSVWRDGGMVNDTNEYAAPGMQTLLDTVRAAGARNVVAIGGNGWATDLRGVDNGYALTDPTGNGIIYSAHFYPWGEGGPAMWDALVSIVADRYPIVIGEVGCDTQSGVDPMTWSPMAIAYINSHHLNWTAWCFHTYAGPPMLLDWTYAPTPFWGQFVKDALSLPPPVLPPPPTALTAFTSTPGETRVQLNWTNPSEHYSATIVRMSTSGYPAGSYDGTPVCFKTAAPGSSDSYLHHPLTAGVTCYYSALAMDSAGQWSPVAHAQAVPLAAVTPPADAGAFQVFPAPTSGTLTLKWTNPADVDFRGTVIRFSTVSYPTSPTDGMPVCDRMGSPGSSDKFVQTGLTNGVKYYYTASSYDENGLFAPGANATAMPTTPTCSIAKMADDGMAAQLHDKVVTAIFGSDGCLYVQEPDWSSGVRVISSGAGLAVGDRVDVTGTAATRILNGHPAERQISGATLTPLHVNTPPRAIAMNCEAVGGAGVSPNVPGVQGAVGANNVGSLVQIAGKVTLVLGNYVYVDDGSNIADVPGRTGVVVESSAAPTAVAGDIVSVTGIVTGNIPSGWTQNDRYIRTRNSGDMGVIFSIEGDTGTISGLVRDSHSVGISGATVTTSKGGYSAVTSSTGGYSINHVMPGMYSVTASKAGFASQTRTDKVVTAGDTAYVNFALTATP